MIRIFFRKVVPIIVTLAVLVGGFLVYNHFQPKGAISTGDGDTGMPADTQPFPRNNSSLVSPGKIPWETQYDKETGRRISRFKADFYDPRGDGTWYVTKPVIELFQPRGQVLQIKGVDGVIDVPPGSDKGVMQGAPVGPPRDGDLHDVIVKLFNSEADQANDLPQMTLTMPNAQFDYDTNRLFTQKYTDRQTGIVTPADQVPVTIRGKDYDFDGTGLVMFWDDPQKQLKSLEIAHGKQLVIHNPSALSTSPDAPSAPKGKSSSSNQSPTAPPPTVAVKPAAPANPSSKQRYSATFDKNVRVVQSGQELVRADQMKIDFIMKEGAESSSTASPPATPAASPASSAANSGATSPAAASPEKSEPITITWTGPLRIVPTSDSGAEPLAAGQSIIHLLGSPVVVYQKSNTPGQPDTEIQSASLVYRSVDGSVRLDEGPGIPMTITQKQANGAVIRAQHLQYSRADRTAVLDGNVDVNNEPRMHLTSSHMKLFFEPGKKSPTAPPNAMESLELRQMDATGNVKCLVPDSKALPRSIESDELKVLTGDDHEGKIYAKTILADGSVRARQVDQELTADKLTVELSPSTKARAAKKPSQAAPDPLDAGDVDLDSLLASGSVHVTGKDGSSATGDTLLIIPVDGHQQLTLTGKPDAVVVNKGSTLVAPLIHGRPDDQRYWADGPGKMTMVQQSTDATKAATPMTVNFDQGVNFNAKDNKALVSGNVRIDAVSADGTVNAASAKQVALILQDKPPTTRPDEHQPAKSQTPDSSMNFMQNKQVSMIKLIDDAKVASELSNGGVLIKRNVLQAQEIDIDETPLHQKLIVPGPGRMLAEDHDPPNAQPQNHAKDDPNDTGGIGGRGVTAFQWEKQMTYDEFARQATMDGRVYIVHTDDGPKPKNTSVTGDHLIADLEPIPAGPKQKAPPANDQSPQMRVTHVTIKGNTEVLAGDMKILAGILKYDPVTQQMALSAGDERDCTLYDDLHRGGMTFSEATLNTKTNTLEHMKDVTAHTGE